MTSDRHNGKLPSIIALLFVTLHVSAFVVVTVLQFHHVSELERNLSVRQAEIAQLTDSCSRVNSTAIHVVKRSLDKLVRKSVDFEVAWKLVNSRQTSSLSSSLSSVLNAQEQQLIQKCSGDVKICMPGVVGELGVKGDKGFPGSNGDPGAQGSGGLVGPTGIKGNVGVRGTTGPKGARGEKGLIGPEGLKGEHGQSGPKGRVGPSGDPGQTGVVGDDGDAGGQGAKGQKGVPGPKGQTAVGGKQGPVGVKGETGEAGPPGVAAVYTGPVCDCVNTPLLSSSPDAISGNIGASLNLSCLANGSPSSSVMWYKISGPDCKVNGTSGNVLSIKNLEPSDLGKYVCVASNIHGNASKIIDVTTTDSLDVLDCTFEGGDACQWNQSRDHKMMVNSPVTSPSSIVADHTIGTAAGQYLYYDTTLTPANQSSRITSMTIPANQDHCFTVWYNMNGPDIGSLQIYKKSCDSDKEQLLWAKTGDQGLGWHKQSVTVPADSGRGIQLVLEAISGSGNQGVIAVDDISLTTGVCQLPLPVITGSTNMTTTAAVGSNQLLNCTANGVSAQNITWTKPSSCRPVTDVGTVHSIKNTTFGDGGKYTCTAANTAGIATKEIILKINGRMTCDFEQHQFCGWTSETVGHPDTWLFHSGNTASSHTGPTNDHTTGTSRGVYLYMEASGRNINDTVVLVSPDLPALNDVCLRFWYNMNGQEIKSLNVYTKDCHGNKKKVLSYVGDKGDAWRESCTKVHSQPNDFNLLIEGVRGDGYLGDIAIDDIELSADVSCSCRAADDPCDFEKDTCSWVQDTTDNFDWTLNSGSTPSLDTGPNGDHTTGTGHYLFVEGSSPQRSGYQAKLLSPVLNPGQQYCLDYWYNMNGANMGTLDVYTQKSNNHAKLHDLDLQNGNKGDNWFHRRLPIAAEQFPFQIVFTGTVGTDYSSDMALDDVVLSTGSCK